jgi:glycosyltransferase involved in cell wall biosynthesis
MKVSIVVPSYNYERYLREAIESVLSQSFRDWELIIVDDGSSDASVEVIRSYQESHPERIRLHEHQDGENHGLSRTYRLGFENSRGDYVALLEADDFWHDPDSLAARVEVLDRHRDVSVVYSGVEMSGEEAVKKKLRGDIRKWKLPYADLEDRAFYAFPFLLEKNLVLTCSCAMMRRSLLERIDPMTSHDAWFDWWMLAQLSVMGKFFYIADKKTTWRVHRTSYIHRFNSQIDLYQESCAFLDRIFEFMKTYSKRDECANGDRLLIEELRKELRSRETRRKLDFLARVVKLPLKKALAHLQRHDLPPGTDRN